MTTKGIRGAITVDSNTPKAIEDATLELLDVMIRQNQVMKNNISHIIFTLTSDLNAEFPAKFVRQKLGWDDVAMMCYHELNVPGSLQKCLRILLVANVEPNFKAKFMYLKGAEKLRK